MATAIESIYRDLEYARSLIKRPVPNSSDEEDGLEEEHGTIRRRRPPSSGFESSSGSKGAPSEDWSVISEQDDRRSSVSSSNDGRSAERPGKRHSLASAVLSVLPDALVPSSPRRRTLSATSES